MSRLYVFQNVNLSPESSLMDQRFSMKNYIFRANILLILLFTSSTISAETLDADGYPATDAVYEEWSSNASGQAPSPATRASAPEPVKSPSPAIGSSAPQPAKSPSPALGISTPDPFQSSVKGLLPDNNRSTAKLEDGTNIFRKGIILKMYKENGFNRLWTSISVSSLADALSVIHLDGLNPADYKFDKIAPLLANPSQMAQSPKEAAVADILLTEAYLRAIYNLNYGKVDPDLLDRDHNYTQVRKDEQLVSQYLSWIKQGRIDAAFDWARPKSNRYHLLKSALSRYIKMKEKGGWPAIPRGKTIKPGKEDERIVMLRFRLAAEGDLPYAPGPQVYDDVLQYGVKSFQGRHGLKADGVIGPATLKVMNIPIERRIQQIRADLDRERWYYPRDTDEYLLVDVADFKVYWMKQGQIYWQSLVQVGKSYTTTPIFRDQIEHIDFNPTWSIPASIKRLNILPSLQVDSSYLNKKGYDLLDEYGNKVDPRSIDWDDVNEMNYTVRQPPGWGNALGKVKFMFPNKHSVFLHDTNQRNYFAKTKRTTSHGCIRLKNPFDFAEMLLRNKEGWDRGRIDNLSTSNRTTTVRLDKPLPILIQYSTVTVDGDKVRFREDIYKRDPKLIAALGKPFKLHLPDLPRSTQAVLRNSVRSASRSSARFLGPKPEIIGTPDNERRNEPVIDARKGIMYFN